MMREPEPLTLQFLLQELLQSTPLPVEPVELVKPLRACGDASLKNPARDWPRASGYSPRNPRSARRPKDPRLLFLQKSPPCESRKAA
jgi:hypothetical protein